jgi:hypothetical protein
VTTLPLSKIFEHELEAPHERVLSVMRDDKFLSLREIAATFAKKYPTSPEVVRWKGVVGDISRYHIARYLKRLEREGYVERSSVSSGEWRRLRQDSLLNEVIQGYVFEGRAKTRIEALKKLADAYIDGHKTQFQQYVSAMRRAKEIDETKNQELKDALRKAKNALDSSQSKERVEMDSN